MEKIIDMDSKEQLKLNFVKYVNQKLHGCINFANNLTIYLILSIIYVESNCVLISRTELYGM